MIIVNSILTEEIDATGRVIGFSKTTFKRKEDRPFCGFAENLFATVSVDIEKHLTHATGRVMVTVSTTQGKFKKMMKGKR